jgi:transketolase
MNDPLEIISAKARSVRRHIVSMAARGKTAHVGSALSCADILAVLYFRFLNIDPLHWDSLACDRFILSKGHAAMAWYAVLAEAAFFSPERLSAYAVDGSSLGEHPCHGLPGVKVASGSLGHGLPMAAGIALAQQMDRRPARTFVLISDGECNEGSVWESAMWCGHQRLDNLIVFVDDNNMQALGPSRQISGLDPLADKWQAFGWAVYETDGHDHAALIKTTQDAISLKGKPKVVIARTVLGKGVSFMENDLRWHYLIPSTGQLQEALSELEVEK